MIVLDKTTLEHVALQLRDDVNVQAGTSSLTAIADGSIALASPTDPSVDSIRARGNVVLKGDGHLTDTYADGFAAIRALGHPTLGANGAIHGGAGPPGAP